MSSVFFITELFAPCHIIFGISGVCGVSTMCWSAYQCTPFGIMWQLYVNPIWKFLHVLYIWQHACSEYEFVNVLSLFLKMVRYEMLLHLWIALWVYFLMVRFVMFWVILGVNYRAKHFTMFQCWLKAPLGCELQLTTGSRQITISSSQVSSSFRKKIPHAS